MEPRYTVSNNITSIRKVFDFEIPMPPLPNVKQGDPVPLTIKVKSSTYIYVYYANFLFLVDVFW